MGSISVQVGEVRVPLKALKRLSHEQRYVYYLLGLIHNESLALRKLITFTRPAKGDKRVFRREAELSNTLLLFRVACGKLWEARLQLNSKIVREVLQRDVYPFWPEGPAQLKSMNQLAEAAKWLYELRNKVGFHYPSIKDWAKFITPNEHWDDDLVFVAQEVGHQFFVGPEAIVRHQMFSVADGETEPKKIESWVRQAVLLLIALSEFTESAVGSFTVHRLLDGIPPEIKPLGKVSAPDIRQVRIPFWIRGGPRRSDGAT